MKLTLGGYDLSIAPGAAPAMLVLALAAVAWACLGHAQSLVGIDAFDASKAQAVTHRIDPNTASFASLRRLPGIGPAKAQAIIDYRQSHGPVAFRHSEDLQQVSGLGPVSAAALGPMLELPSREK